MIEKIQVFHAHNFMSPNSNHSGAYGQHGCPMITIEELVVKYNEMVEEINRLSKKIGEK